MIADDKISVAETVYRYAYGIDTRDFALYRTIFADEVAIDFSSYNGQHPSSMSADVWVARVQPLFCGLDATQHTMSNPLVDVNNDHARCRMYMQAIHILDSADPMAWFTIGGYYDDTLVRSGMGWLITGVTLTVLWRQGDPEIMKRAAERGSAA